MSILIKGMEMPTEGYIDVRIKCNGTASFAIANNPYFKAVEAVPVPPHGRLIDADALIAWFEEWYDPNADLEICHVIDILDDNSVTPTILEAEEGET